VQTRDVARFSEDRLSKRPRGDASLGSFLQRGRLARMRPGVLLMCALRHKDRTTADMALRLHREPAVAGSRASNAPEAPCPSPTASDRLATVFALATGQHAWRLLGGRCAAGPVGPSSDRAATDSVR
jgi:hypothetical protein